MMIPRRAFGASLLAGLCLFGLPVPASAQQPAFGPELQGFDYPWPLHDYAFSSQGEALTMHDGTTIHLRKLDAAHDVTDRAAALTTLERARDAGEIVTGLLYIDREAEELHDTLNTTTRPLNELAEIDLCPGSKALEAINASLR